MSSGKCSDCGKEFKNIEVHKRHCKNRSMKKEAILQTSTPILTPSETITSVKPQISTETKDMHKECTKPSKLLKTSAIKEMKLSKEKDNLTDEEKFLRFFGNLPKWTTKKLGFFQRLKIGAKDVRHCVLTSRDPKKIDVELYVPYNKELGLLQTDTDFYDMPVKEKGTIYLDADKFRPILNGAKYSDEFDIPEDFANSLINRGINFGQLSQFKHVLKEISSLKAFLWVFGIVTALAIIALFLAVYSNNKAFHDMASQVGNMTNTLQGMGR